MLQQFPNGITGIGYSIAWSVTFFTIAAAISTTAATTSIGWVDKGGPDKTHLL